MLTSNMIMTALTAAQALAMSGKSVRNKTGGAMEEVHKNGFPLSLADNTDDYPEKLSSLHDKNDVHKALQSERVSFLADVISKELRIVTSEVIPMSIEYSDAITQDFNKLRFPTVASEFDIRVASIPEPLEKYTDALAIATVSSVPKGLEAHGSFNLDMEMNDILQFITTGHSEVDTSVGLWFADADHEKLKQTWDKVFNTGISDEILDTLSSKYSRRAFLDHALLIHLGALMLAGDVDGRATGMDRDRYIRTTKFLRNWASAKIDHGIQAYNRIQGTGTLILDINQREKRIEVLKPEYDTYIQKGGTASALLGRILSTNGPVKTEPMLAAVMNNTRAWENYVLLNKAKNQNQQLVAYRSLAKTIFKDTFATRITKSEMEFYDTDSISSSLKDQICSRAMKVINDIDLDDMAETTEIAGKIIASAKFHFTPALEIFKEMTDIKELNPTIKPHEATLIVTVNRMGNYLADNLVLVNNL